MTNSLDLILVNNGIGGFSNITALYHYEDAYYFLSLSITDTNSCVGHICYICTCCQSTADSYDKGKVVF